MKTKLFALIFSLLSIKAMSQKKIIYLDDDLNEITERVFNIDELKPNFYSLQFEKDTVEINVLVQRIKKGKIEKKLLDSIRTELSIISNKIIPNNHTIVVLHQAALDPCNHKGYQNVFEKRYKKFLRQLNKIDNISNFFLYKGSEEKVKRKNEIHWLDTESYGIIEKTFIPINYPCGSYIIIDSCGNFYVCKGEYAYSKIIDLLKHEETIFADE